MDGSAKRDKISRVTGTMALMLVLSLTVGAGCSDGPRSQPGPPVSAESFRKIRFGGEWVAVSFRSGLAAPTIPEQQPGFAPKEGDRVILSDVGSDDVFVAGDLDALKFYHSSPGADQINRFRSLADAGKLFIVAKGTTATVAKSVEGELPEGLKAIKLSLAGPKVETAWVSEPFLRPAADPKSSELPEHKD